MATILVGDDESGIRSLVRQVLNDEGHEVLEAADGVTAWALIEQHRPDLVLLDLDLPEWSGSDLAAALRAHPVHAKIPIVVCSGWLGKIGGGQRRIIDADAYLAKPFTIVELVAAITPLLPSQSR